MNPKSTKLLTHFGLCVVAIAIAGTWYWGYAHAGPDQFDIDTKGHASIEKEQADEADPSTAITLDEFLTFANLKLQQPVQKQEKTETKTVAKPKPEIEFVDVIVSKVSQRATLTFDGTTYGAIAPGDSIADGKIIVVSISLDELVVKLTSGEVYRYPLKVK